MDEITIEERKIYLFQSGSGGPVVFLGIFKGERELVESVFTEVSGRLCNPAFILASYEANDWNSDFSPWKADGANPGEHFCGNGEETLSWLINASKVLKEKYAAGPEIFLAGYSLAGLFSLWGLYSSSKFKGCACCSGSLWYPGWDDFVKSHDVPEGSIVYLSLGGKEEKSSNPVMASIGSCTRQQDKLLSVNRNVLKNKLEMNPGGHFASPDKRLAKGIVWLLSNQK